MREPKLLSLLYSLPMTSQNVSREVAFFCILHLFYIYECVTSHVKQLWAWIGGYLVTARVWATGHV
jgi:hypothetical protein